MKKQNQQNKKKIPDFVWQVAAIVLACVCAVCFRPSMGIVRMLPIPFLCMLVCAFLPVKCWQRLIYFLLLSVALNAVELNDNVLLAVAAVAILIAFVCAELTAWLIRRKKTVCTVLAAALFVACPLASSLLVGNPITAWKADKQIDSYTERTYDLQEGGISKSKLSFDFYRRAYTVTMTSESNPTETGTVGIRNGILSDGYLNVLEAWYQRKATEQLSAEIRNVSEKDSFHILPTGINGFPFSGTKLTQDNDGTYDTAMTFCIQLSGKTDFEKLKSSAVTYGSAFKKSGVPFEKIVFSSYNSLGARAVFAAMPCDYDGILFHSVKPLFLIRAYGDRYRICSDELLTSFCK